MHEFIINKIGGDATRSKAILKKGMGEEWGRVRGLNGPHHMAQQIFSVYIRALTLDVTVGAHR